MWRPPPTPIAQSCTTATTIKVAIIFLTHGSWIWVAVTFVQYHRECFLLDSSTVHVRITMHRLLARIFKFAFPTIVFAFSHRAFGIRSFGKHFYATFALLASHEIKLVVSASF